MNKKKSLTVFLVCLLLLVAPVYAATTYREGFESWGDDVLEWDTTETGTGNLTVGPGIANDGLFAMNCSVTTTGGGAQAFINTTVSQFSGNTSYVGFDIKIIETKTTTGQDARVAAFSNDIGTFCYLEINDNSTNYTWEFNNVDTNEPIIFDTYHTCVLGVKNTSDGWAAFWLNDVLIQNNTADYSAFDVCNLVSVGLVNELVNKDCEILVDNIIISGDYPEPEPFEYTFWFMVTGVITMFFVTGFTVWGLKGNKIKLR